MMPPFANEEFCPAESRVITNFHRFSLCLHPDLAEMTKASAVDMPGNLHNGLVASATLCEFGKRTS
jgi:hypothetical protein